MDSKNSQTTPATTSTSSIRQLLGAADAQTAHAATTSTAPTHRPLGSANAGNDTSKSTGRSGGQNAATRRNMRSEDRVTAQGPVKKQQRDGMPHRGGCPPPPFPMHPCPPPSAPDVALWPPARRTPFLQRGVVLQTSEQLRANEVFRKQVISSVSQLQMVLAEMQCLVMSHEIADMVHHLGYNEGEPMTLRQFMELLRIIKIKKCDCAAAGAGGCGLALAAAPTRPLRSVAHTLTPPKGGGGSGFIQHIQHSPGTPTTGLRERGSTGRSGRQNAATRRSTRRGERVTVQGPVKKQQPDGMSHGGGGGSEAKKKGCVPKLASSFRPL